MQEQLLMWVKDYLLQREQGFGILLSTLEFGIMQNQLVLLQHGYILIKDFGKPACSTGGFPTLRRGSLSNYVLIAQDDLNTLGFRTNGLDGIFGSGTQNAVREYQRTRGLSVDGIVGCNTWRSLQEEVVGSGPTATTIN